ncbi:MAG TPA: cytochrome c [Candidatus Acidoferrales bacterium]|nr:cytochrome c [Candidatus Acidoferrales bacterium]
MRKLEWCLVLVSLLLLSAASGGAQKPRESEELGAELGKAPESAAVIRNPYAGQPDAIEAGRKLFKRHCARCHGPEGHGLDKAPDLRAPLIQNTAPGKLRWFLRNGNLKEGMPSWSKLPDERLWQIVSYLQTLK